MHVVVLVCSSVCQRGKSSISFLPFKTFSLSRVLIQDNGQYHRYELGTQMNLFSSPTPLSLSTSLPLSSFSPFLGLSVFPFSLMLSQAAVLFWVMVSDAQVTKAQRCPVSTLLSVSGVLRQMLAEAEMSGIYRQH